MEMKRRPSRLVSLPTLMTVSVSAVTVMVHSGPSRPYCARSSAASMVLEAVTSSSVESMVFSRVGSSGKSASSA